MVFDILIGIAMSGYSIIFGIVEHQLPWSGVGQEHFILTCEYLPAFLTVSRCS